MLRRGEHKRLWLPEPLAHSALAPTLGLSPPGGGRTAHDSACSKASTQEDGDRVWKVRDAWKWLALCATLSGQGGVMRNNDMPVVLNTGMPESPGKTF